MVSFTLYGNMSSQKSSQQPKLSLEARIHDILTSIFPEYKCSVTDIKFPKKEFVYSFYCFMLEQLQFCFPKLTQVSHCLNILL